MSLRNLIRRWRQGALLLASALLLGASAHAMPFGQRRSGPAQLINDARSQAGVGALC